MSKLKDSCCIICNKNITVSSTISIKDYIPLSNPQFSLYSFFQLISNFIQLDISEVPQNACDKCYQGAMHVLDFQILCNKAVENIKTYSEDIEDVYVGNDCDNDLSINGPLSLYPSVEDIKNGYNVDDFNVEIITENSDNDKPIECSFCGDQFTQPDGLQRHQARGCQGPRNNEASLIHAEDTGDGSNVDEFNIEIITKNADNAKDEDIVSLPAPLSLHEEVNENSFEVAEINAKDSDDSKDEDFESLPAPVPEIRKRKRKKDPNIGVKVECGHCHKLYRKDHMHIHNRMHSGNKPYKCKLCPTVFNHATSLNDHMRIHNDERPFLCTVCGAAFRQNNALTGHMLMHTGARPYTCEICGKSFRLKSMRTEHYSMHSDMKPFACAECPKRFRLNKLLKQHMVTHAKIKPIECTLCGKRFTQKHVLRSHLAKSCQGPGNNEASLV